jgi:protein SCO1/2
MGALVRRLRIVRWVAWAVVAVSLLMTGGAWLMREAARAPAPMAIAVGGPFALTDHNGRAVSDQDYRGAYMLIYFGYINCPDICVPALNNMSAALDELGTAGDAIQPLFITVDPLRDTIEAIAGYVPNFHARLIGLTGTVRQTKAVSDAYGVFFEAEEHAGEDDYLVGHSSYVYLIGPDGEFLTVMSHQTAGPEMAAKIKEFL